MKIFIQSIHPLTDIVIFLYVTMRYGWSPSNLHPCCNPLKPVRKSCIRIRIKGQGRFSMVSPFWLALFGVQKTLLVNPNKKIVKYNGCVNPLKNIFMFRCMIYSFNETKQLGFPWQWSHWKKYFTFQNEHLYRINIQLRDRKHILFIVVVRGG